MGIICGKLKKVVDSPFDKKTLHSYLHRRRRGDLGEEFVRRLPQPGVLLPADDHGGDANGGELGLGHGADDHRGDGDETAKALCFIRRETFFCLF